MMVGINNNDDDDDDDVTYLARMHYTLRQVCDGDVPLASF